MYQDRTYYDEFYGPEWTMITTMGKKFYGYKCIKCKKKFKTKDLDMHHILPISWWLKEGFDPEDEEHYCFGIKTKKPWHTEDNVFPYCMKCHSKEHPHLIELYKKQGYHR